jgi:hypothetical protein
MKIDITNPFITISDFQKIIKATQQVFGNPTDEQPELIINITNEEFTEFDLALVGYLILCKQKKPILIIKITFPSKLDKSHSSALFNRLSSYNVYSKIIHKEKVFSIEYEENSYFTKANLAAELQIHKTFSPIIPIGKYDDADCYRILFHDALDPNETNNKHPDIKTKYRELGIKAFVKCLNSAKIKSCYDYEQTNTHTKYPKAGYLNSKYSEQYYNAIRPIVEKLKNKPIAFHFLFALILQNVDFPKYKGGPESGKGVSDNQESFKNELITTITNLWDFTKGLFYGINELAKNISEHASTKQGIITLRAYNSSYIDQQKSNDAYKLKHFYDDLDASIRDKMKCVIDINVFDLGDQGVVPTLIKKTEEIGFIRLKRTSFHEGPLFSV